MGFKNILITQPSSLKIKNKQLVISSEENSYTIPLEDINTILIDTPQTSVTSYLLQELANYKITLITCNKKHLPSYLSLPYYCHSRELKVLKAQLNCTTSFKNRMWQKIIQQKIRNSSKVLEYLFGIKELSYYISKVLAGDVNNIESQAAKAYWRLLFTEFKRHGECKRNLALNYGYSIIRSTIAKYITCAGLIPCLGIHHCSELNNFNLVDDLIEPFRAIVDLKVVSCIKGDQQDLSKTEKGCLLDILNDNCIFEGREITVDTAIEYTVANFCKTIKDKNIEHLKLPEVKEVLI